MIRPTDLGPVISWAHATTSSWRAETRPATSWFDPDAAVTDTPIVGDPSLSARGLSVEQHAARVLMHLRGERDVSS